MNRLAGAACFVLIIAAVRLASACPFCSPPGPTLAEELTTAKVAVIAKFVEKVPAKSKDELPLSRFEIVRFFKGQESLDKLRTIDVLCVSDVGVGTRCFIADDGAVWQQPIICSERAEAYLDQLAKLPANGVERLVFFLPHLEDREQWLRDDAYDEFAKAPYADVKALKSHLRRDVLVAGIRNRELAVNFRRLYLTLLGICGTPDELPLLETLIRTPDRDLKPSLDAVVACYLTLRGAEGLPVIEKEILTRPDVEYIDIYATVQALRFHGEEERRIERSRLGASLRLLINQPKTAELVIPDLARWQDWSAIEDLSKLFREVNNEDKWIRVPIVQYVHACPLPAAKEQLESFRQLDSAAVKLGTSPFPLARRPSDSKTSDKPKPVRDDVD